MTHVGTAMLGTVQVALGAVPDNCHVAMPVAVRPTRTSGWPSTTGIARMVSYRSGAFQKSASESVEKAEPSEVHVPACADQVWRPCGSGPAGRPHRRR